jgi:outer membrane receptor protein involved in Fe transport
LKQPWATTLHNLPLFINNAGDQRKFLVVNDVNQNAVSFKGMIRYQLASTLALVFNADFYNFYGGSTLHVWNEPAVKLKGDVVFHPIPALAITAYLAVMQDIYALNAAQETVKLSSIADLGGNIEYSIIPRVSVFLQVTNLLNDKYQRWLGYQAYGINLYGGVRFKF